MPRPTAVVCAIEKIVSGSFRLIETARYTYFMRKFYLIDFAAHYQKGFRNHVVPISEVPAWVESFDHYGCLA